MNQLNKILGISGSFASGKSIAAQILSKEKSLEIFSFGKMIEEILAEEGIEVNRKHLQAKGLEIIQKIGYNGIADLLVSRYKITTNAPCIIEGIRHVDVATHYYDIFSSNFKLLFIDCSKETRFTRIKGIPYKGIVLNTREEFDSFDTHKLETEMEAIMKKSDKVIINEGSKEEFTGNLLSLAF